MAFTDRLHNRGSISTGYDIENSLKFESDNTEYLMAEGRPAGNQQTWTYSCWLKRTEVDNGVVAQMIFSAGSDGKTSLYFRDDASYPGDQIFIYVDEGNSLKWIGRVNQSFRDTAAWYHIVFAVDSTDATAADRTKIYVNGVQQTITFNDTLNQNVATRVGDAGNKFAIGGKVSDTGYGFNGYMAECVLVDGSALTPTSFGEYDEDSGIWKPKDVSSLSLGTAGFHMNFDDSSNVGAVQSGTSQGNFDKYNLTSADQATDTPTNNFCTINPLIPYYGSVSEGATKWLHTASGDGWESFVATMGAGTSGKWYAEFKFVDSDNDNFIGICPIDDPDLNRGADHFAYYGSDTSLDESVGYYAANGYRYIGAGGSSYGNTYARTNIMSIAVDMDNGKLYFAKDGVWQNSGDPTSGATGTGALDVRGATKPQSLGGSNYASGEDILANYGGFTTISISTPATDENGYGTFEYAPPTGYYALCTKNLAEFG